MPVVVYYPVEAHAVRGCLGTIDQRSLRNGRTPAELPALLRLGRPRPRENFHSAALCHWADPSAAELAVYHGRASGDFGKEARMSLKDDIKIIFKLRPYESFTRNDLLLLLIDYYNYTDKLKLSDLDKALKELKKEGFILTCGRKHINSKSYLEIKNEDDA